MKKILILLLLFVSYGVNAQDIYSAMPSNVKINQSWAIRDSLEQHIAQNENSLINGYRIRIFFDNKQNSRTVSEETELRFISLYPGYNTYRSFANPFFKVTIGDFRTKQDANAALREIVTNFPEAFVVKEKIHYPSLDPVVQCSNKD